MARVLLTAEVEIGRRVVEVVESSFRGLVRLDVVAADLGDVKARAYNKARGQIRADLLLDLLKPARGWNRYVYVVEGDGYVPGLNFVFGVAHGHKAVVFTERLRSAVELFEMRLAKEIVHELGHTFGLGHCADPRCVMYFSNTIKDTDLKGPGFCEACFAKLTRAFSEI